jgi:hypothetical protein
MASVVVAFEYNKYVKTTFVMGDLETSTPGKDMELKRISVPARRIAIQKWAVYSRSKWSRIISLFALRGSGPYSSQLFLLSKASF